MALWNLIPVGISVAKTAYDYFQKPKKDTSFRRPLRQLRSQLLTRKASSEVRRAAAEPQLRQIGRRTVQRAGDIKAEVARVGAGTAAREATLTDLYKQSLGATGDTLAKAGQVEAQYRTGVDRKLTELDQYKANLESQATATFKNNKRQWAMNMVQDLVQLGTSAATAGANIAAAKAADVKGFEAVKASGVVNPETGDPFETMEQFKAAQTAAGFENADMFAKSLETSNIEEMTNNFLVHIDQIGKEIQTTTDVTQLTNIEPSQKKTLAGLVQRWQEQEQIKTQNIEELRELGQAVGVTELDTENPRLLQYRINQAQSRMPDWMSGIYNEYYGGEKDVETMLSSIDANASIAEKRQAYSLIDKAIADTETDVVSPELRKVGNIISDQQMSAEEKVASYNDVLDRIKDPNEFRYAISKLEGLQGAMAKAATAGQPTRAQAERKQKAEASIGGIVNRLDRAMEETQISGDIDPAMADVAINLEEMRTALSDSNKMVSMEEYLGWVDTLQAASENMVFTGSPLLGQDVEGQQEQWWSEREKEIREYLVATGRFGTTTNNTGGVYGQ